MKESSITFILKYNIDQIIYLFKSKKVILLLIGKYTDKMLITYNFLYFFRWMLINADIVISLSFEIIHQLFSTDTDSPKQI